MVEPAGTYVPANIARLLHHDRQARPPRQVDANQIPGYHPISSNLPDWKIHRLERKNRDAANIYAETNPHQSQQYNNDTSLTTTTTNELAEKLQRRLDKVTKATIE
ncbi:unnamed protein product [Schistosoma curassoni]|uniref:Uncharacterized protein n=1 Tax=Schistosoma curassoni TaxID=6186 RepID=A0A183K4Q5_9TREM|nr:unnamed protein product [Schistosoma curassoni]